MSLENYKQQQQIKKIVYATQKENKDIIKIMTFPTTLKRLGMIY